MLLPALEAAGFRIDRSEAGLYLWATEGQRRVGDRRPARRRSASSSVPGTFYGDDDPEHVRVALTATDERIAAAERRSATARPTWRDSVDGRRITVADAQYAVRAD